MFPGFRRLLFQPTSARACTIQQMGNDQLSRFLIGQSGQRHSCTQQFTHVGQRKPGQYSHTQLFDQTRRSGESVCPIQWSLGNEPRSQSGQCCLMLPGTELVCLEFVPAQPRLAILDRTFYKVPLRFHPSQTLQRRVGGGIAQRQEAHCLGLHQAAGKR